VKVADFIKEHCSTHGTGDLSLTGATDLSVGSFREAWSVDTEVYYSILDGANRESGIGTFNGNLTITRDTIVSTVENDIYNDTNPSPIDLQGQAIVACTMSARAFDDLLNAITQNSINITLLGNTLGSHQSQPSAHTATSIIYNSTVDDITSAVDVQNAMDDHSTAIESNASTIAELDDDLAYREAAITALESGGLVTQYNPTTIVIAAGRGEIIDSYSDTEHQVTREIVWPELIVDIKDTLNGMPIPTGIGNTDIAIYYNGSSDPTINGIKLGFVEYFDRVITNVNNEPIVSNQVGNTLLDYIFFIDWTSKMNGMVLRPTAKTVPDRSMWRDEGLIFGPGVNHANELDNPNVVHVDANGGELINFDFIPTAYNAGTTEHTSPISLIPNDVFEADGVGGVGGLTTIGHSKVVIHYVFESLGGTMYLNYGQKEYTSFDEAVTNLYADRASHHVPAELASFILLGQVVILEGSDTFGTGAIEIFPINSTISSGSTGSTVAQAVNISYTDAYGLNASNVQTALDALANVRLTGAQHDAIRASQLPSTTNPYITKSAMADKAVVRDTTARQKMIGELELPDAILSALDEQINDNAVVDVFIYDTSLDDDGGAWNISGFPKLSLFTLEAGLLSLYNANGDMSAPFKTITTAGATSVTAKHGMIGIGTGTGFKTYNIELNYLVKDWTSKIVNAVVNDVAVTGDGQGRVIWACATDGGVSVIHPDGSVVSSANTNSIYKVKFLNTDLWWTRNASVFTVRVTKNIFTVSNGFLFDEQYQKTVVPGLLDGVISSRYNIVNTIFGNQAGLTVLKEDVIKENGMVAYITADYCSGYLHGDIKGAWLASTDDTDLTIGQTDPDRSINGIPLTTVGTIVKESVAAGAELVGYSGFAAGNYLEQAPNTELDFGTGDFYVMCWVKQTTLGTRVFTDRQNGSYDDRLSLYVEAANGLAFNAGGAAVSEGASSPLGFYQLAVGIRESGTIKLYVDGSFISSTSGALTVSGNYSFRVGLDGAGSNPATDSEIALVRVGAGAPTAQQIKEIYDAELPLFQPNAKCLLQNGDSNIKALDYDESTGILKVCDAVGTTSFKGLQAISSDTEILTSISTVSGKELTGEA